MSVHSYSSPRPPSTLANDALLVADITRALDVLQDYLAIIDLAPGEVVWCSTAFAARFPAASRGTPLENLLQTFDGLETCLLAVQVRNLTSADSAQEMEQGRRSGVVRYQGNDSFEVVVATLDEDKVVLRMEDITERERVTQRHLEDRERLLFTSRAISVGEMATTLAHELNQPIGAVSNLLRGIGMRLRRGGEDSGEILTALDRAIDQAVFASRIIARIRDYTHSLQPRRERIDLVQLVSASVALLDWEIRREGIAICLNLADAPLPVEGDEVMLQQVLVNLLRNAIDAMRSAAPDARRLDVGTRQADGQVEITVSDSGCGLSAEAEKNLFVPFVSTKPTGMGVGLNICRSFVELHQGRLWLSHNEDMGCTFHITLPVSEDATGSPE
jgi:two-component system sensor histidine kinase DctS